MRTDRDRGIEVMRSHGKECLGPPEAGRGKKGSGPSLQTSERAEPAPCFQTYGLHYYEALKFCCFKPACLLYSISLWQAEEAKISNFSDISIDR